jgi:hypothetical protein
LPNPMLPPVFLQTKLPPSKLPPLSLKLNQLPKLKTKRQKTQLFSPLHQSLNSGIQCSPKPEETQETYDDNLQNQQIQQSQRYITPSHQRRMTSTRTSNNSKQHRPWKMTS